MVLVRRAEAIEDPDGLREVGVSVFEPSYKPYVEEHRPFVEATAHQRVAR